MPKTYRKLPIEIQAIHYDGTNQAEVVEFMQDSSLASGSLLDDFPEAEDRESLYVETLEGIFHISKDDFVIKGVQGEFYPCKPDIFWKTYELVE